MFTTIDVAPDESNMGLGFILKDGVHPKLEEKLRAESSFFFHFVNFLV